VASHGVTHKVGIGGGGRPGGPDDDQRDLLKGNLGERVESNLGDLLERAEALLREHRAQVLALAHALETHKTIAGEDVVAVLDGTPGPLIDGTAYHEPTFLAQLEAYHGAVEAAHERHEKVSMALPMTNGQAPEPEAADVESTGRAGPVSPNGGSVPAAGPSFT
jgi:cell division protease FtsH